MDVNLSQAIWVLGLLPTEQLPNIAVRALQSGMDSPSLRILAGLVNDDMVETNRIFKKALKELSLPLLSLRDADRVYATAVSRQILNGEISPEAGANVLWEASIQVGEPDFHELDPFIYAASELQSRPEDGDFFDRAIIEEAQKWARGVGWVSEA